MPFTKRPLIETYLNFRLQLNERLDIDTDSIVTNSDERRFKNQHSQFLWAATASCVTIARTEGAVQGGVESLRESLTAHGTRGDAKLSLSILISFKLN